MDVAYFAISRAEESTNHAKQTITREDIKKTLKTLRMLHPSCPTRACNRPAPREIRLQHVRLQIAVLLYLQHLLVYG